MKIERQVTTSIQVHTTLNEMWSNYTSYLGKAGGTLAHDEVIEQTTELHKMLCTGEHYLLGINNLFRAGYAMQLLCTEAFFAIEKAQAFSIIIHSDTFDNKILYTIEQHDISI